MYLRPSKLVTPFSPVVVALVAAAAAGCGAAPGGGASAGWPDGPPTLHVEVGTGVDRFIPLAADDPVAVFRATSPQGGAQQHVWTSLRVAGHPYGAVRVRTTLLAPDVDTPLGEASVSAGSLSPSPDGRGELVGLRAFVVTIDPDQPVRLRAEVLAGDGAWGSDERRIRIH